MKKILFIFLLGGILLFPFVSLAGQYIADGNTVTYDGLVPCGKEVQVNGGTTTIPCQFCHIFVILKGIFDFLLMPPSGVVFLIGVLMLVVAGVMFIIAYLISPDNPGLIKKAQSTMTSVITGLIIIFSAWLFVNVFFLLIGVADWTGLRSGWFTIECNVKLPEGFVPPAGSLAFGAEDKITIKQGQDFDLGVSFNTNQPVNNMNMDVNFSNNLLVLKDIIPNTQANFKTFLPIKNDGSFDKEKVINQANTNGVISFGATCFDFNTGTFGESQDGSIDSLVILVFEAKVFEAKNPGTGNVQIDSENSKLAAALGNGDVASILKKESAKIEIIIE